MTATVEQARDQIYGLLMTAWSANAPAGAELIYDDAKAKKPDGPAPWARATVRHTGGGEIAINGGNGLRRYNRTGTLFINLFCPSGDGLRVLDPLVKVALDAYEGKYTSGGVWFTKAQVREIGIVKGTGLYQINVLINFSYDEVK